MGSTVVAPADAAPPPPATIWGLLSNTNSLVRFSSTTPGTIDAFVPVNGLLTGEELVGIDFRPRTGQLYGIGRVDAGATDTLRTYTIDTAAGTATLVGSSITGLTAGDDYGTGFNPTVDRIRVVNNGDENLRINPNNGGRADSPVNDMDLNPAGGVVTGIAYDRSWDTGLAVANRTTLFAISTFGDVLVTIGGINQSPSPNGGALANPMSLGPSVIGDTGFDIDLDNKAFASMVVGGQNGLYTINLATGAATLVGAIGNGNLAISSIAVAPRSVIAAVPDSGANARVRVFDASRRTLLFSTVPFGSGVTNGVRVALGDVNLDGVPDLITASGPGAARRVRLFNGINGAPLGDIVAYAPGFLGGVSVAAGDVNGDGNKDVITAAGAGNNPQKQVRIFSGSTRGLLAEFDGYAPSSRMGLNVASADFDRDGDYEIVTAPATGRSTVRVFGGTGALFTSAALPAFDNVFSPYPAGFNNGVSVAAGDVNGDGVPEIVTGAGRGDVAQLAIFNGLNGSVLRRLKPFGNATNGLRVALADVDLDGRYEILATLGTGATAAVRAIDGKTFQLEQAFTPHGGRVGANIAGVRR